MPRNNVYCDHCQKLIGKDELAYFSDIENDLDFCSEKCCTEWNKWKEIHPSFTFELQQEWIKDGFTYNSVKEWIGVGLSINDSSFAWWLINDKKLNYERFLNYGDEQELKKEFNEILDKINKIKEKYSWNSDEQKENKSIEAKEWLEKNYPQDQRKNHRGTLNLSNADFENHEENPNWIKLTGHLDLSDFDSLGELFCQGNELTSLNLTGLNNLWYLQCDDNLLTNVDFLSSLNCENLGILYIQNNNISNTDIAVFSKFVNLRTLSIGNNAKERIEVGIYNRFYGSLASLKNLTKLTHLGISNTDINSGLEFLPLEKLEKFYHAHTFRPESKVKELNVDKEEMNNLLNKNLLNKNVEEISLTPYWQFSEMEEIAEGGFGTIYKAKHKNGLATTNVALKILHKKNVNLESLRKEFFNHQLIGSHVILNYTGITQTPDGNYALFMPYCSQGTLRSYLGSNSKKIDAREKVYFLSFITAGLQAIHSKGLVHKDFHPNNVLIRESNIEPFKLKPVISDLGLSALIDDAESNKKVMGVLPYIAPEVLCGEPYTQAADVYSLSMIMYEVLTGYIPFHNRDWSDNLSNDIVLHDVRPEITVELPKQLVEIIKSCWHRDSHKRPTAQELGKKYWNPRIREDIEFIKLLVLPKYNHPYQINLQCHPSVYWASKWWKIVAKIQNLSISDENATTSKNKLEIHLFESKLNSLKATLAEKQQMLFDQFASLRKEFIKDKKNKKKEMKAFKEVIKGNLSENLINEVEQICDELVELELENETEYQALIEQSTS